MKPINLYEFTKAAFLPNKELQIYEKFTSDRAKELPIKDREIQTLKKLISLLSEHIHYKYWDGFYYSFSIPQISKEFDLLKLGKDKVLDIELKSEYTSDQKLFSQLKRNTYYLSHLNRAVSAIVFVGDKNQFYQLKGDRLCDININDVVQEIKSINEFDTQDIEKLFQPTKFLVSPINTPDKFIGNNYFLTDHQEEIRDAILKDRTENPHQFAFYQVVGGAGTGKTLLIYDIAKQFAEKFRVCIIHCGYLADGHHELNKKLKNVSIMTIKDFAALKLDDFDGVVIDEAHRIRPNQLELICGSVRALNKFCVFGMDGEQYLSKTEAKNNINEKVRNLEGCKRYPLTNKIRTNKELADFIRLLRKINEPVETKEFPNVKILYADSYPYANQLIMDHQLQNYKYISFTPSSYQSHNIDKLLKSENTHKVIGQEFDNVVMVINESFQYMDDGRLGAYQHPNPDYLFAQLLYQGITRVREKLAIIVLNNEALFVNLLKAIDRNANS